MISNILIGLAVLAIAVMAVGFLAKRTAAWLTIRQAQKPRDAIASGVLGNDDGLSDEKADEYFKLVQLVKFKCSHAENYIAEGKEERLERTVVTCLEHAHEIEDDYYRSVAMNYVAQLLRKAGATDRALGIEATMPVKPHELSHDAA